MPATDIYDTLIVPEDDVITYDAAAQGSNTAFWLVSNYGSNPGPGEATPLNPTLINFGEIHTVNNQTGQNVITDMIALFAGSSSFWIGVVVENHGLMTATSELGEARVFSSSSWSPSLINTGTMIADSNQGLARTVWTYGLDLPYGPFFQPFFVHNTESGEIIADAAQAFAVASIFANFTNDGLVRAIGGSVSGIGVRSNGGYIENNGDIIATASGPTATSWGICLGQADAFNGPRNTTLINTGLISAQIAIDELYNGGVRTNVTNSGQIVGHIIFYDGDDSIRNTGSINGNITLGAGADVYDGRGGAFTGAILSAGDGDDVVNLGDDGGYIDGGGDYDTLYLDYSGQSQVVSYLYAGAPTTAVNVGGVFRATIVGFESIRITGGNGYDQITTGDYDDVIDLQRGGGVANGGGGEDLVVADFSDRSTTVVYAHNNSEATVLVNGASAAVIRNAERVQIMGGSAVDQLTGGTGDDILGGGAAGDALDGGGGMDIASYVGSNAAVSVTLGGAVSGGHATGDTLTSIEGVIGSSFNDVLTGDANANYLDGAAGADTLTGGAGDDSYYVDNAGDVVVEAADSGNDRVYATVTTTLSAHVEELQLNGDADLDGFGNALANSIIGNAGDNLLWGGAGADVIDGGAGFDTLSFADSASGVNANMTSGLGHFGDADGDVFFGIEALIGSSQADQLFGSAVSDWIEGGAGADLINGQDGYDTVTYRLSSAGVVVNLFAAGSAVQAGGDAAGDILLNIEGVIGSAFDDIITGSHANNELEGGDGNDWLSSYGGNDRVNGGAGFDYVSYEWMPEAGVTVDLSRQLATELYATDILISIEAVIGTAFQDHLIGDGADNVLNGQFGNDQLMGAGGNDTLYGGNGVDVASYGFSSAQASWHRNPDGTWTVTSTVDGADTLERVEFLDFTDRDVCLDRAAQSFSGDGTSDLLLRNSSGTLSLWFVNGASITGAGVGSIGADWTPLSGDFNGDARDDILWRNTTSGAMSMWFMDGAAVIGASFGSVSTNWVIEGLGDFNGDTRDDILWRDTSTGAMSLWFLNGASVSGGAFGNVGANWVVETLGDFNGDGRDDILWRDTSTGSMSMWFMNGQAVTGGAFGNVGATWVVEGAGDYNGDGRDDIFWRNSTTGDVSLWFMNGQAVTGSAGFGISTAWDAAALGDYNGDGRDDVIWRDGAGNMVAWFINGASVTGQSLGSLSTDWVVNPGG